jgi:hypothetical protein
MKKIVLAAAVLGALVGASFIASSASAESRVEFCSRWTKGCIGSCNQVPGSFESCRNVCRERRAACQRNGCFVFNRIGTQCQK